MEALPAGRKVCWGATIKGPGLNEIAPGDTCALRAGLTLGFVEAGGVLEASVPTGTGRRVDLFAFIQPPGSNEPCPGFNVRLPVTVLLNTFAMGFKDQVDMSASETQVAITASFPGATNNLATTNLIPETCTSATVPRGAPLNGRVSNGANIVGQATSGYTLKARIGHGIQHEPAVSSTGYKLLVKGMGNL